MENVAGIIGSAISVLGGNTLAYTFNASDGIGANSKPVYGAIIYPRQNNSGVLVLDDRRLDGFERTHLTLGQIYGLIEEFGGNVNRCAVYGDQLGNENNLTDVYDLKKHNEPPYGYVVAFNY